MAAVDGLNTSERRKSALRRHIWRPTRFRTLLDRFAGRVETPAARQALIASDDPMAQLGRKSDCAAPPRWQSVLMF